MDYYNPPMGGCGCGGGSPITPMPLPAQNMAASNANTVTAAKPAVGGITKTMGNRVPTMEDIASFTSMTPEQQEQQRQQLEQSGSVLAPGMPGYDGRSGQARTAAVPSAGSGLAPLTPTAAQAGAITGDNLQYLNGFLRTQIGRPVLVTFLIGTNTLTDRSGILIGVGINYILLNETQTDDVLACDFYNIKFIRFYY